jgi:cyanophycinase
VTELAGGDDGLMLVIPTASKISDIGDRYVDVFRELGMAAVEVARINSRSECESAEIQTAIKRATGIFLTGGNQLRLSTVLGGTEIARLLRQRNAEGVPIAGTSAGAAFLSEHMIAYGRGGGTPRAGKVSLAPGLGLTNRVIVDQHFRERDRIGRLMAGLAYNPFPVGLGVDEDTAAFIGPDDILEVVGNGGITVVDPSKLEHSSMASATRGAPLSLFGITVHVLAQGDSFDLSSRKAIAGNPED